MKKINIKDIKSKSVKELAILSDDIKKQITTNQLKNKSNPVKDTNLIKKLNRTIAQILTVINEKKFLEKK